MTDRGVIARFAAATLVAGTLDILAAGGLTLFYWRRSVGTPLPPPMPAILTQLFCHIVLVGLPIAFITLFPSR